MTDSYNDTQQDPRPARSGFSGKQVFLFLLLAIALTAALTFWLIRTYVYASDFKPVELSSKEQVQLDGKLRQLGMDPDSLLPGAKRDGQSQGDFDAAGRLRPQAYSEAGATRDINLSERELNAIVASNPDMAKRLAIDLSDGLASARLLVPVDPDFPILGGKTLRVNAGLTMDYVDGKPQMILRGVSVMGVPIPNAWLGNLKNVDLVNQFGGNTGFWQSFADGVELIQIEDDRLHIKLKE